MFINQAKEDVTRTLPNIEWNPLPIKEGVIVLDQILEPCDITGIEFVNRFVEHPENKSKKESSEVKVLNLIKFLKKELDSPNTIGVNGTNMGMIMSNKVLKYFPTGIPTSVLELKEKVSREELPHVGEKSLRFEEDKADLVFDEMLSFLGENQIKNVESLALVLFCTSYYHKYVVNFDLESESLFRSNYKKVLDEIDSRILQEGTLAIGALALSTH